MRYSHTGPPEKGRPDANRRATQTVSTGSPSTTPTNAESTSWPVGSQQVDWWAVHLFCRNALGRILQVDSDTAAALIAAGPIAGTPQWSALPDDDPMELAAVVAYSPHHALRINSAQAAMADAGSAISTAADWGAVGQRIREHNEWKAAHPWLQRRTA